MSYTKKIGRHYGSLMQNLNRQRFTGEFCDIEIIIEGRSFKAHQCILAAASKKLHSLIRKTKQTDKNALYLENMSASGFKIILEYIYTSSLWIPPNCLTEVSNAAMFLEMEDLVQSSLSFDYSQTSTSQTALKNTSFPKTEVSTSNIASNHEREFAVNVESNDLIENKLPDLDSTLRCFLDGENHVPQIDAANVANYGDISEHLGTDEEEVRNPDLNGNDFPSYPDQDALSEISMQNDGPNDEDLLYQLRSHSLGPSEVVSSSGTASYPYEQYNQLPTKHSSEQEEALEQSNTSRRFPKMIGPVNMPFLPHGIIQSHHLLQNPEPNRFISGDGSGYFMPQAPAPFYGSNMNIFGSLMQEHSKDMETSQENSLAQANYNMMPSGIFNNQSFESSIANDKRSFASYDTTNIGVHSGVIGNEVNNPGVSNNTEGQMYNLVAGRNNVDLVQVSAKHERRHYDNEGTDNTSETENLKRHEYSHSQDIPIHGHSRYVESRFVEEYVNSTHFENTERSCSDKFVPNLSPVSDISVSRSVVNVTGTSDAEKMISNNGSSTGEEETSVSNPPVSTSYFSSRPVARMPPKKAGYRGIDSDYNREFNTGIKSNIVGQYDNLAALVESHGVSNTSRLPEVSNNTVETPQKSREAEKSEGDTTFNQSSISEPYLNKDLRNLDGPSNSGSNGEEGYRESANRHNNVHDFYLTNESFTDHSSTFQKDMSHSGYVAPSENDQLSTEKAYGGQQPSYNAHSHPADFYGFSSALGNSEAPVDSDMNVGSTSRQDHVQVLSPISAHSVDICDYDPRDSLAFNPANLLGNVVYDSSNSHFPNINKMTPTKSGMITDSMYSHFEEYLRNFDPSQSPVKHTVSIASSGYAVQSAPLNGALASTANQIQHSSHVDISPSHYGATPYYPQTLAPLHVNTESRTVPEYTNISPCIPEQTETTPATTGQSQQITEFTNDVSHSPRDSVPSEINVGRVQFQTDSSSVAPNQSHIGTTYSSLEDVRKNILHVLSQEKFEEDLSTTLRNSSNKEACDAGTSNRNDVLVPMSNTDASSNVDTQHADLEHDMNLEHSTPCPNNLKHATNGNEPDNPSHNEPTAQICADVCLRTVSSSRVEQCINDNAEDSASDSEHQLVIDLDAPNGQGHQRDDTQTPVRMRNRKVCLKRTVGQSKRKNQSEMSCHAEKGTSDNEELDCQSKGSREKFYFINIEPTITDQELALMQNRDAFYGSSFVKTSARLPVKKAFQKMSTFSGSIKAAMLKVQKPRDQDQRVNNVSTNTGSAARPKLRAGGVRKSGKEIRTNKSQLGNTKEQSQNATQDLPLVSSKEQNPSTPSQLPVNANGSQNHSLTGLSSRNVQPLKIPRYGIITEYKEASVEKQSSGEDGDKIVKPLKKRIKLKLNMTLHQDETEGEANVTRPGSPPKQNPDPEAKGSDDQFQMKSDNRTRAAKSPSNSRDNDVDAWSSANRRVKYTCELCGREFWERYRAFAEHMQAHSRGALHTCSVCGIGYQRLEDLTRHRNTAHAQNTFQCEHCQQEFTNSQVYRKHCADEYGDTKAFRCLYAQCTFRCGRLNVLERHTLIHGLDRQFQCVQCGKKFAQPNGLRHHLVSCMNLQSHACSTCGKTFNRVQSLREHEALHDSQSRGRFTCSTCNAAFTDQRNLKRHERIHSNDLPYECTHCGVKFRYSNVLKRHLVSKHQQQVEKGKKGCRNKDTVLVRNYNAAVTPPQNPIPAPITVS